MKKVIETGHAKNVANFELVINHCIGFADKYNPSKPELKVEFLQQRLNTSKTLLKAVKTSKTTFDKSVGERQLLFKPLKPFATKIINALKSQNVPAATISDARTIIRKVAGKRANNETIPETNPDNNPETKKISVSQQSYDNLQDTFDKLATLIANEANYNPNEAELTATGIQNYLERITQINSQVKKDYIPYSNAMIARDKELYTPEVGIVDLAIAVKSYLLSVFGASSPEYKKVSKIPFETNIRK
jgi:hypothetical protein